MKMKKNGEIFESIVQKLIFFFGQWYSWFQIYSKTKYVYISENKTILQLTLQIHNSFIFKKFCIHIVESLILRHVWRRNILFHLLYVSYFHSNSKYFITIQ